MPIRYELKDSRCLSLALLGVHAGVLGVLWLTQLPWFLAILMSLMILASLYSALSQRGPWFKRHSRNALGYAQNRIMFFADNKITYEGEILPQTVVTPYFILLCLKSVSKRNTYHRFICCDELSENEYRHLCVLLRLS